MDISVFDLLNNNFNNIIDIRDRRKYAINHIPGAINIDKNSLLLYPEKYLNKYDRYYLYCDYGNTSRAVVNKLRLQGYDCINIIGGFNNYLLM